MKDGEKQDVPCPRCGKFFGYIFKKNKLRTWDVFHKYISLKCPYCGEKFELIFN